MIDKIVFYDGRFQHITAIFHIFMYFLGFNSTRLELWSVLPKDTSMKHPKRSSAAQTWLLQDTLGNILLKPLADFLH